VRVQVPFGMLHTIGRLLMKSHGVGKRGLKEIVVAGCDALENVSQSRPAVVIKGSDVGDVVLTTDQQLKWPNCPERHQGNELGIFANQTFAGRTLQFKVITQETAPPTFPVLQQRSLFLARFVGDCLVGPNLSVGMQVTGAHHLAAVFEDLDMIDVGR